MAVGVIEVQKGDKLTHFVLEIKNISSDYNRVGVEVGRLDENSMTREVEAESERFQYSSIWQ